MKLSISDCNRSFDVQRVFRCEYSHLFFLLLFKYQDLKKCSKFDDKTDDDTLYFKPHHKLVGGKKCTYGPAYWCASKENAAECHVSGLMIW